MSDSYRVLIDDVIYGPMSRDQLAGLISSGRVSSQHSVSKNNGPWAPAEDRFADKGDTAMPPPVATYSVA